MRHSEATDLHTNYRRITSGRTMAPRVGDHEYETLGAIDCHIDYRRITSGGMMAPRVGGHEYETELSTGQFSWTRPDPTRRNVDPTRPAIADKKSAPTRTATQPFSYTYSI